MNLNELFSIQAKLDERIVEEHGLQGEDLLDKKILALQVELGELANEWRGFKFWSKDQEPRTKTYKSKPAPGGGFYRGIYEANPLLEEYVDCLHFILSIGLELEEENVDSWFVESNVQVFQYNSVIEQFIYINQNASELYQGDYLYDELLYEILGLGEMLGFTWEQIEQAYLDKNKINHERQSEGY